MKLPFKRKRALAPGQPEQPEAAKPAAPGQPSAPAPITVAPQPGPAVKPAAGQAPPGAAPTAAQPQAPPAATATPAKPAAGSTAATATEIESLRAWIAELDRRIGTRTYIAAAMTVLAVVAAAVALVLAVDARENSASDDDLNEVASEFSTVTEQAAAGAAAQAEIDALETRVTALESEGAADTTADLGDAADGLGLPGEDEPSTPSAEDSASGDTPPAGDAGKRDTDRR